MGFVETIADHVTVLHQGQVLAEGSLRAGTGQRAGDRGLSGALRRKNHTTNETEPTNAAGRNELNQYYGGSHILRGLSFEARTGEVTCLLGRNGVGKTTLLKCLMGLVPAKTGEVRRLAGETS